MLKKEEFNGYREIIESDEVQMIMSSMDADAISDLGGRLSVIYARMSNELATVKDAIMAEVFRLSQTVDEKGKPMAMGRAELEGELSINAKNEVTRREMEYLMSGMDKISFACSARVRSFAKEGNY